MPVTPMMLLLVMLMMFPLSALTKSVLLGAGTGLGSCAAPPYRARKVHWVYGCPPFASCCTELGFCRSQAEWEEGNFRDCNGVSNGRPLPEETEKAEAEAGPYQGTPAGAVGPAPILKSSKTKDPEKAKREKPGRDYSGGRKKKSETYYQQNTKENTKESQVKDDPSENEINDQKLLPQGLQKRIMNDAPIESSNSEQKKPKAYPVSIEHLPNKLPVQVPKQEGSRHVRQPFTAFVEPSDGSTSNPINIQVHIHDHNSGQSLAKTNQELMKQLTELHQNNKKTTTKTATKTTTIKSTTKPKRELKNITLEEEETSKDELDTFRLPRQSLVPPHLPHTIPLEKPIALTNVKHAIRPALPVTPPLPLAGHGHHPHPVQPGVALLDTSPIETLHPHPPVHVLDGKFIHPDPHPIAHSQHPPPAVPLVDGYGVHAPHPVITDPHPPPSLHPHPLDTPYHDPAPPPLHPHPPVPIKDGYGHQHPLHLLPNPHHSSPIPEPIFSNFPSILSPTPGAGLTIGYPGPHPNFIGPTLPDSHAPPPAVPLEDGYGIHAPHPVIHGPHHPPPQHPTSHEPVGPLPPLGITPEPRPKPFVHFGPGRNPEEVLHPLPPIDGHHVHDPVPHPIPHAPHPVPHPTPHPVHHPIDHPHPSPHPELHLPTPTPDSHPDSPLHPHPPTPPPKFHLPIPTPDNHPIGPLHPHPSPQPSLLLPEPNPPFHLPHPQPDYIPPHPLTPTPHPDIIHVSPHPGSPHPGLHPTPHPPLLAHSPHPNLHPISPQPVVHQLPPQPGHHPTPDTAPGLSVSYLPPLPQQPYYPQQLYAYPMYAYPYYDSYLPPLHSLPNPNIYDQNLFVQPPLQPQHPLPDPNISPLQPLPHPQPLPPHDPHHLETATPLQNIISNNGEGPILHPLGPPTPPVFGGTPQPLGPAPSPSQFPLLTTGPLLGSDHGLGVTGNLQPIGPTLQPIEGNIPIIGPNLPPVPEPIFRPPPGLALVKSPANPPLVTFENVALGTAGKRSRRKLEEWDYYPKNDPSNANKTSDNSRIGSFVTPTTSNLKIKSLKTKQPIVKSLPREPRTFFLNANSNNYLKDISNVFESRTGMFGKESIKYKWKKSTNEKKKSTKKNVSYKSKIEIISKSKGATLNNDTDVDILPKYDETITSSPIMKEENIMKSEESKSIEPKKELQMKPTLTTRLQPKVSKGPEPTERVQTKIKEENIEKDKTTPKQIAVTTTTPFVHFPPLFETINKQLITSKPTAFPKLISTSATLIPKSTATTSSLSPSTSIPTILQSSTSTPTTFTPIQSNQEENVSKKMQIDQEKEIKKLHQTIEGLHQEIANIMENIEEDKEDSNKKEKLTNMKDNKNNMDIETDAKDSSTPKKSKSRKPRLPRKYNKNKRVTTTRPSQTTLDDSDDVLTTQTYFPLAIEDDATTITPNEIFSQFKLKHLKKLKNKKNNRKIRIKTIRARPKIEPYEYPLVGESYDLPTTTNSTENWENFVTPVPTTEVDTTTVVYAIPLESETTAKLEETTVKMED